MVYFGFVIVDLVLYVGEGGWGVYLINGLLDLFYSYLLIYFIVYNGFFSFLLEKWYYCIV
jgi:hypothetical protein